MHSIFKDFFSLCQDKMWGLILFGASKKGLQVKKTLESKGLVVKYFCDNDKEKSGSYIDGIKIIPVDELAKMDRNLPIYISSQFVSDIASQLREMGFINIGGDEILFELEDNYSDILYAASLLEDEKSKEIYFGLIKKKVLCETDINDYKSKGWQYFDEEIIKFCENEVFVDGGGFIGDTVMQFNHISKGNYKKIYSFEPNKNLYSQLINNTRDLKNLVAYEKGIYNQNKELLFLDNSYASSINNDGEIMIETVMLDEILRDEEITFIKLDVEGVELECLEGAKSTIQKNRPKLAICIYHKPDDFWELPIHVINLVPEYKLYIRHYGNDFRETVLYCIP